MALLPAFTLPAFVARIGTHLPALPPTLGLTTLLNLAPRQILPRDVLAPLTGKRIEVRVRDAGLALAFTLGPQGFRPASAGGEADLALTATARDFLALALREEDPDTLFFSRRLLMEGDTELGLLVKNTLDGADWQGLVEQFAPARFLAPILSKFACHRPATH
jgi:O2-independent ubiquinone biosynthesis accessory factor UbiT